ncbi:protein-L-isoaspartate(D-aspartate) O-methyltransferase [Sphingomonas changbaiensis]|nr:protein-L-isoaspartate(D-aspartate) O-methyltransferase [Sphingomonas changbaiensis]
MVGRIRRTARREYPKLAATPAFRNALRAVGGVRRELFMPESDRAQAYEDTPLPIGYGQTISDAYIVTVMTAALNLPPHAHVLEVGTGSGYQAAVLSGLAGTVHSIEIVAPLADRAKTLLASLGMTNVTVRAGDGFLGWPEAAPYDGVIVTAGAAEIPPPLIAQLKPGGTLVMPIGPEWPLEQLLVVRKAADGTLDRCSMGPVMFVPLTGRGERVRNPAEPDNRATAACF